MSEQKKIARATGIMGAATSLSRLAGLVRDMVVAALFGAGHATDAFFLAFTIPNLLRRFFAEGSLTAAFVPTYAEIHHQQGEKESARIANICWTLLLLVMFMVVIVGILASPWVVKAIGYGFVEVEGKLALTNRLNQVMFPYIFFVSLLALITGILNVREHFFWPSFSPLLLNLSMIGSALLLSPFFAQPIMSLAIGVLLGGILQLALQFPVLSAHKIQLRLDFNFRDPAVLRIARLMVPGIAGVAIYQLNVIVTRLLASFLAEGSVSYLYYAQRLFEFPQGIFVVSLAQAVLPTISRQVVGGEEAGFKETLRFSVALIVVVIVPAIIGLIVCSEAIFSLFFMRGAFDYNAVHQTAMALAVFAPGLLFVGISRVVVPTFYAFKDTRTPVLISFWTLLVNVAFGLLLMIPFGHLGLALALTLSAAFNCLMLLIALRRKIGPLGWGVTLGPMWRILPSVIVMALASHLVLTYGVWDGTGSPLTNALLLFVAVIGGGTIYALGCWWLRVPGAAGAARLVREKLVRKR